MPQVANNRKSTTPESDVHSIHVHIVREGVCTHLQRNLKKDSQSRITLGSPEGGICAHYPRSRGLARPVSGPITLFSVLAVMIALDRVHIDTHRSPHIGSKLRYVRATRGVG